MTINRHIWDEDLIKWRSIERLDSQAEVFQYTQSSMAPHPARDFCVLRFVYGMKDNIPQAMTLEISL